MKRVTACGLVVAVAAAIAASIAPGSAVVSVRPAADKSIKIGMANFSLCCAYFIGMSKSLQAEAKAYPNVNVLVTNADGKAEKLTSNIDDLLAQRVDGIIVSGAWLEAAPAALNAIKQAGVPVVLVDRELKGGTFTSYVGPDNFTIGRQDGGFIVKKLGGKGRLVVIRGGPEDNSIGKNRTQGMLSVVKKSPGITVTIAPNFGEWSTDGGLKQMENLLAKYKDIRAVFCENDSMCLGAQKAIADAKRSKQMFLVGVDGQKEALLAIKKGTNYAATGLNSSDQIGRAGFNRLMAILAGAAAPQKTILPSPLITRGNVAKYYDPSSIF
jgi:ribose transport system substrate-binding protein